MVYVCLLARGGRGDVMEKKRGVRKSEAIDWESKIKINHERKKASTSTNTTP
jgi:hypothetical protein